MRTGSEVVDVPAYDAETAERELTDQQRRFAEISAELAQLRHQSRSDDSVIRVTVDGHGTLLDLQIADGALRRAHPGTLGPQLVSTIYKARAEIGEVNRKRLAEILAPPSGPAEAAAAPLGGNTLARQATWPPVSVRR